MEDIVTEVRRIANLVNLSTPLGLLVARLGRTRVSPGQSGLWYAESYSLPFPVAGAFTVGNVIIMRGTVADLGQRALAHEVRHTWQYVLCGTFFLPLYVVATGWSWLRTGDRAARNVFERAAGLGDGGYTDVPVRPLAGVFLRWVRR